MDDLDEHLLARLRDNARAPVAELARALGLSRTTIQSRLARLERTGVIAGYAVRLSPAHRAAGVEALVMLNLDARQGAAVTAALKRIAGVERLQAVSGAWDMIATVVASDTAALDALLGEVVAVKGVERASASVVLATRFER